MKPRTAYIRDYILEHGEVRTDELCALFPQVSAMTIRRDLAELESARLITRTHGGARAYHAASLEAYYTERENARAPQKAEIASKASPLVRNTHCIYLDAGTTAMSFARRLPDSGLTVVTSAPNVALEIVARKPGLAVILLGGSLNPKTLACSGPSMVSQIDGLNIDMAFMATTGLTTASGFTVGDWGECTVKRAVIARAQRVIMLLDSAKYGISMPYTFARPRDLETVVTDSELPQAARKLLMDAHVKII